MGWVGAVTGIVTGLINTHTRYEQASIARKMGKLQYRTELDAANTEEFLGRVENLDAQFSAEMAEMQANMQAADVYVEASRVQEMNANEIQNIEMQYIKNGVDIVGSPLMVLDKAEKDSEKELNALENQAENLLKVGRTQAGQYRARGAMAETGSKLSANARRWAAEYNRLGTEISAAASTNFFAFSGRP